MPEPRLIRVAEPERPDAAVIVLHGGGSRPGDPVVSTTQLSVLRMAPIAAHLARVGRGRLAVFRLLNSHRGWDALRTPVDDAHWALEIVRDQTGDVPLGLVGHSLGGRAALLAGAARGVRSVVALNAWMSPGDRSDLAGRRVLMIHGDRDRIASPHRARSFAASLPRSTDVTFTTVEGGKHAMLRHGGRFQQLAAEFTRDTLLGHPTS